MKKISLLIFSLLLAIISSAQDLSLEVDCQNPGWLSNLVTYTEQQTVKNIKITGYINAVDLSFLGSLNKNQQLNGIINLEDVQIVGESQSENNKITKGYFSGHIQHLILPKSLESVSECLTGATLDTLTIGGSSLPVITNEMFYNKIYSGGDGVRFNTHVKHLILRSGVKKIADKAFYNNGATENDCIFETINIPSTVTYIGKNAFRCNYALKKAELSNNVDTIGNFAFKSTQVYGNNDSIYLPQNLKHFYFGSYSRGDEVISSTSTHCYYGYANQHIFVSKNVETIDASDIYMWGAYDNCYLHISNENPPTLTGMTGLSYKYLVAYVPKTSVEIYKSNNYWKNVTILPEPNPAKKISIDLDALSIIKGNSTQVNVMVLPIDADDRNYTLKSSNPNIASVSQNGNITAVSSGEAIIYAILDIDKSIIDSCLVKVYQPVTMVNLDITSKEIKVGDILKIEANVSPSDADNNKILWYSDDEELATVENGIVTALKPGVVNIYAKSEFDRTIYATCKLSIIQPVMGISLNNSLYTLKNIGDFVQLEATIMPQDATDKDVIWKSSNENVCIVSNGKVVAIGYGTSVIIATSKDGGYMATCIITVEDATDIEDVIYEQSMLNNYTLYTIDGQISNVKTKGIKIIKFNNGTTKKIIIK